MHCINAFKCTIQKANVESFQSDALTTHFIFLLSCTQKATKREDWKPAAMHNVNKLYHSQNVKHNFNIIIYFLHATSHQCSLQHFLLFFLLLCNFVHTGEKKLPARQQNDSTHIFLLKIKSDIKKTVERFPERDACMQMWKKLSVAERWEVKEEHCSCCSFVVFFSEKGFIFQFISICTLSRIAERGRRRKWKEKNELLFAILFSSASSFSCYLCHFSLWKQTVYRIKNWIFLDNAIVKQDKQVAFPDVVKQINHFFISMYVLPLCRFTIFDKLEMGNFIHAVYHT